MVYGVPPYYFLTRGQCPVSQEQKVMVRYGTKEIQKSEKCIYTQAASLLSSATIKYNISLEFSWPNFYFSFSHSSLCYPPFSLPGSLA